MNEDKLKPIDWIYIVVLIIVFLYSVIAEIWQSIAANIVPNVGDMFSDAIIVFLGLVGLIDIFRLCGWEKFVPTFIVNKDRRQALSTIKECINAELDSITLQPAYHVEFFLKQVGLSRQSYIKLQYEIIRLRLYEINSIPSAQQALRSIIAMQPVVINQESCIPAENRVYFDVKYYLDFSNIMFERTLSEKLVQSLAYYIQENEPRLDQIEWIVMPSGGNYLLCYKISEALNKKFLPLYSEAPIDKDKKWLGTNLTPSNCIIINDVLVSGKRIKAAADALSAIQESFSAYFLVGREEYSVTRENLFQDKVRSHCLISVSDDEIKNYASSQQSA